MCKEIKKDMIKLDIIIDSNSIIRLSIEIVKGLIIGLLLFTVLSPFYISGMNFVQGYKDKSYQYLITGCVLIGSLILLFCVIYFGFGINLLRKLLE